MERLTEHHVDGKGAYMKCSEFCELEELDCARCEKSNAILDRLAAYEDTGLEPEEVEYSKLALMGKVVAEVKEFDGISIKRLQELAQAEKDGRLVVLPCKVGDLLYEVDLPEYGVITCKVSSFYYHNGPRFCVPGNDVVSALSAGVEVIDGHGKGSSYTFELEDFGKTVFLTRQEAEEALRKEADNG